MKEVIISKENNQISYIDLKSIDILFSPKYKEIGPAIGRKISCNNFACVELNEFVFSGIHNASIHSLAESMKNTYKKVYLIESQEELKQLLNENL